MKKFCDGCHGLVEFPDDARSDARFCSSACRQRAYRLRTRVAKDPQGILDTIVAQGFVPPPVTASDDEHPRGDSRNAGASDVG